jgi:hypothetical protein
VDDGSDNQTMLAEVMAQTQKQIDAVEESITNIACGALTDDSIQREAQLEAQLLGLQQMQQDQETQMEAMQGVPASPPAMSVKGRAGSVGKKGSVKKGTVRSLVCLAIAW